MTAPASDHTPTSDRTTIADTRQRIAVAAVVILAAIGAVLLMGLCSHSGAETKPLKVYNLAGQSNMEGQARI